MSASPQLSLDLAGPPPPRSSRNPKVDGAHKVYVATPEGELELGPLLIPAESIREAQAKAGALAGVDPEKCLALPAREGDFVDELMEMLKGANERAEADLQKLRAMHAKILGCSLEELDSRMAAEKAEAEKATRERKAAPRNGTRRSGAGPSRAGSSAGLAAEASQQGPASTPPSAPSASLPTRRLTDRQRALLEGFEVAGNIARFTSSERVADWAAVKEVFVALGGKWRTGGKAKVGGFHFPDDADGAELVRLALATGEILDPRAAGFFPTPAGLADRLVALADIRPGASVLEPSAGRGAIALAVRRACPTARISCVELLPDNRATLEREGFALIGDDFLKVDPKGAWFDAVVMNPPFGKRADLAHVEHAFQFLNPSGSLVSVMSAGAVYRDDEIGRRFRHFVEMAEGRFEENPDGSFAEAGTMVRTVTLVIPRRAK